MSLAAVSSSLPKRPTIQQLQWKNLAVFGAGASCERSSAPISTVGPFYELEQFIRYKADTFGMEVIGIDPKYTSQGCSGCGHTEKANRYQHRFLCKACGYELHADLNASRNTRLRGVLARQVLGEDAALSCAA